MLLTLSWFSVLQAVLDMNKDMGIMISEAERRQSRYPEQKDETLRECMQCLGLDTSIALFM